MGRKSKENTSHRKHGKATSGGNVHGINNNGYHDNNVTILKQNGQPLPATSNRKRIKDLEKLPYKKPSKLSSSNNNVFPARMEIVVFLVTLLVRVSYVAQKRNWWILHPDEVFQIVEVAHSEVYGYGFRAYEYLSPPQGNFSSASAQAEAQLGMFALRSFLLPKLFMFVFTLAEFLGLKDRPFLVAKIFHAAVASCLPLSTYKLTKVLYLSHDIAVMAAVLVSASVHITLFGTHVLVNSFLSPIVFWCLASVMQTILPRNAANADDDCYSVDNNKNITEGKTVKRNNNFGTRPANSKNVSWIFQMSTMQKTIMVGFFLGLATYIRIDLLLFLTILGLPFALISLEFSWAFFSRVSKLAIGFLIGMAVAGTDDWLSYGQWGLSIHQWLRFNLMSGLAATFFGKNVGTFYFTDIFLSAGAESLLITGTLIAVFLQSSKALMDGAVRKVRVTLSLLFVCVALVLVYSSMPHKENRFIHNVFVVLCILQAKILADIAQNMGSRKLLLWGFSVAYIAASWTSFPSTSENTYAHWTFNGDARSHELNQCLSYVSDQNDVTGVFNGLPMQSSGGFSLLHKKVTFFTLVHQEICEYSSEAEKVIPTLNPFKVKPYNITVSLTNRASDYVTSGNLGYIYKVLVEDRRYNYAIIPSDTDFSKIGYVDVFKSGRTKVTKRSLSPASLAHAETFAKNLPIGTNATVLEYEGGWLISLGVPSKAISRLEQALTLDKNRVRVYQLLMTAYHRLGKQSEAIKVQEMCFELHGRGTCLTPQRTVELYAMYANRS